MEHWGDIYYMENEVEQAVKYWQEALDMGSDSKTLKQKIKLRKYITEPEKKTE